MENQFLIHLVSTLSQGKMQEEFSQVWIFYHWMFSTVQSISLIHGFILMYTLCGSYSRAAIVLEEIIFLKRRQITKCTLVTA